MKLIGDPKGSTLPYYISTNTGYEILSKKCDFNNVTSQNGSEWRRQKNCAIACILGCVIFGLVLVKFLVPIPPYENAEETFSRNRLRSESTCQLQIVESIPIGLNFSTESPRFMSTYEAWTILLNVANNSLDIGSFYWTLRGADIYNHSTANEGEQIFEQILSNGISKKLNIRIAQSAPTPGEPNIDTQIFEKNEAALVRSVDFPRLLGGGVLHTKLWIVDNKHFYLGSANMDWRSLTQVKEMGVLARNCSSLARDVAKIFNAYWYLGQNSTSIPDKWPNDFSTAYNWNSPLVVDFNSVYSMSTFFSSSPPPFSAEGRTNDLDAILNTIASAESFVNIAVMDYYPLILYTKKIRYWPYIDDAIRTAAVDRKISVKMLISRWPHSNPVEDTFLRSLCDLSSLLDDVDIQVKRFIVPSDEDQSKIPFGRVNHNKYMVTDNTAYIGTSNWSGDYFTDTAGIALVLRDINSHKDTNGTSNTIRVDLLSAFQRDWSSQYAFDL